MKAFLMSLKSFSLTVGGLIVVIVAIFLHANIIGLLQNFPTTFNLATIGGYLATLILLFAVVWAQLKGNALLSHGILFYIFSSSLSGFIALLFSNAPGNAFTLQNILDVVVMLYALGVVLGFVLYDRPKPEKLTALATIPFFVYFAAYYLYAGFNSTLLSLLIVLVALLLGSKVVGLAYALFTITGPIFSRLQFIIDGFTNNTPQQVNNWFIFGALVTAFVFLLLDFIKSIQENNA